jgi:hypothetical protein
VALARGEEGDHPRRAERICERRGCGSKLSLRDAQETFTEARKMLAHALLDLDLGSPLLTPEWPRTLAQRAALTDAYRGMLRACRV